MKSVLIVDDDKFMRDEIVKMFQNSEYELVTSSNSLEAWEKIIPSVPSCTWDGNKYKSCALKTTLHNIKVKFRRR